MTPDPINSDDPAVLRAEISRLRGLVGPAEQSYIDLQLDVLAAQDHARGASAQAGVERGQVNQMAAQMVRQRQLEYRVRGALQPAVNGLKWVNRSLRSGSR